jgi:uroporphyrin-3 C-methyltransferase
MPAEIESLSTDPKGHRNGRGVSPMLVALVVLGLLLGVYAHWRFGQFDAKLDRVRANVAELRGEQDRLDARVAALASDLESSRSTWRTELKGLRDVPSQVDELGRSVEELRTRTDAPQRAWVRAEAMYLLELAERRLKLEGDVTTALAAMTSADARLAAAEDPAVREVREKLATEIAALRAVRVVDLREVLARIGQLEDAVAILPVRGMPVSQGRREKSEPDDATGGVERALRRVRQAVRDLVSLRRIEPAMARLVTPEEESLRRQHLELLLFAARVAAMRPDGAGYVQSLGSAGAWMQQYFDSNRPEVADALAEIAALAAIDIDPALPPVGAAARVLQDVIRGSTTPP